jgi:hypothetical protein
LTDFGGQNIAPKKIEITRFHRRVNKRATTQEDLKDEQMRFVAVKIILVATLLAACSGSNADSGALGDKSEESESGHSHSHEHAAGAAHSLNIPFDSELIDVKHSVQIIKGEVAGGVQRVRAELGEVVAFAVASDAAEILHLHGYDLVATIEPGISAVLVFEASIPGLFEIELENAGLLISKVEIR